MIEGGERVVELPMSRARRLSDTVDDSLKRVAGRALRTTVYRPGKVRPVLFGNGSRIRLTVESRAPLHKYLGTAEWELGKYMRQLAPPGARCFDVGGYDGHIAMTLARMTGETAYCFEPNASASANIKRNLALNGELGKKVRLFQTYIADISQDDPPIDSLDGLIARGDVPEPDFVKIDVECAEMLVLAGARQLLRERRPNLLIEVHSRELSMECLLYLEDLGYNPEPTVPQRKRFRENRGDDLNECIVAFGER